MVWAVVAVIAVLGVVLPGVGWWVTTRRAPPVTGPDRGHGEIDRWLAGQFGLGSLDRERVRIAVLAGRPVNRPGLEAAVGGLAVQVLDGRFRSLRQVQKLGWFCLAFGPAYVAAGLALLISGSQGKWQVEAWLGVIYGAVFILLGWHYAIRNPSRVRRNAEQIVRSGYDSS